MITAYTTANDDGLRQFLLSTGRECPNYITTACCALHCNTWTVSSCGLFSDLLNWFNTLHSDLYSKKLSKNLFLSENILRGSIYPSQPIEVHFCVKNSNFLIFIKLASFWLFYLINYKKNLAFSDHYSLSQPKLPKIKVFIPGRPFQMRFI